MPPISPIHALMELLRRGKFDYADEKICQSQIETFLRENRVSFIREYNVGNGIIDFFFPRTGIAMEVKASKTWSKVKVYRQCERYCEHEQVKGLVLASGKAQGLPLEIKNKPVRVFQLGVNLL
ncbi:hypothetical protein [Alteromonas sp. 14N.309.X.WAT.G.H12]|uniref:hypothetical protein n=1 Tax=Alteromonas sp. 14N.309.X.WAT.G.H12 TaxID=3120824 RepID=UPI002FD39F8E